jgi:hypothetical protein
VPLTLDGKCPFTQFEGELIILQRANHLSIGDQIHFTSFTVGRDLAIEQLIVACANN